MDPCTSSTINYQDDADTSADFVCFGFSFIGMQLLLLLPLSSLASLSSLSSHLLMYNQADSLCQCFTEADSTACIGEVYSLYIYLLLQYNVFESFFNINASDIFYSNI